MCFMTDIVIEEVLPPSLRKIINSFSLLEGEFIMI